MGKKKRWIREKYFAINYYTISRGFYELREGDKLDLAGEFWIEPEEYYLYDSNDVKKVYQIKEELTPEIINCFGLIPYFEADELIYLKLMVERINDPWITNKFVNVKSGDYGTALTILAEQYFLQSEWIEFLEWYKVNYAIKWCEEKEIPYRVIDAKYLPEDEPGEEWRQRVLSKLYGKS